MSVLTLFDARCLKEAEVFLNNFLNNSEKIIIRGMRPIRRLSGGFKESKILTKNEILIIKDTWQEFHMKKIDNLHTSVLLY